MGAGEKLTSPELVADAVDTNGIELLFAGVLAGVGAGIGFGAGFAAGFAAGFCRATGTPCFIGLNSDLAGVGVGLGAGLAVAGVAGATGVLETGAFVAGAFVAAATVRVLATDLAQTVTEVGPVFDENAKPPEVEAEQAQAGIGDSW